MVNEVRIIFIIAFIGIVVFMIGSHINSRKLKRYGKLLQDKAKDRRVKYAPYGADGFKARILYDEGVISQLDLAIKLVDRYNFMHYVLSLFTKDTDTMAVWFKLRDLSGKRSVVDRLNSFNPKKLNEKGKRIHAIFGEIDDERVNEIYDAILRMS